MSPGPSEAPSLFRRMKLLFSTEGWSGTRVRVRLGHGPGVATFEFATWKTRVAIETATAALDLRRDPADGALVLYRGEVPEAQAVRAGWLSSTYALEWATGAGRLRTSVGLSTRSTLDADGAELAALRRTGWTGRRAEGTFPDDWPLERALFVAAVAHLAWREADAAAAA